TMGVVDEVKEEETSASGAPSNEESTDSTSTHQQDVTLTEQQQQATTNNGSAAMGISDGRNAEISVAGIQNPSGFLSSERSSEMEGSSLLSTTSSSQAVASAAPGATTARGKAPTKHDSMSSADSDRVGAVDVRMRAYGNRPAWSRNQSRGSGGASSAASSQNATQPARTTSSTTNDQSNVPPEMRGFQPTSAPPELRAVDQSNLPPELRIVVDQSNVPPELRAMRPPESASGGGGSSALITADVSSAPIEETGPNDTATTLDTKRSSKRMMWIYVGVALLIVAIIVGVAVGVSSAKNREGNSSNTESSSTQSPISDDVNGEGGCPDYDDLEHYVDPESMDEEATALYDSLVAMFTTTARCSPKNLAAAWVANAFVGQDTPDQTTLSNQLALATLYFHWNGQGISEEWMENSDACTWPGVGCSETEEIIEIDGTSGSRGDSMTLPTELGLMTGLSECARILPFSGCRCSIFY
ncbi:MAG: hypothetical protein SGILL_003535, partial [Bacillariaceae sp.]